MNAGNTPNQGPNAESTTDVEPESESLRLAKTFLRKRVALKIDRPAGSFHPKHGFLYPVNYGFVPGTKAPDGEELDAYFLGISHPLTEAEGTCVAIVHRLKDDDDKLVVVADGYEPSNEKVLEEVAFQEAAGPHVLVQ